MTEQQRPDEEVEGHGRPQLEDEPATDDVEGHYVPRLLEEEGSVDDVTGNRAASDDGDEDDVGGHGKRSL